MADVPEASEKSASYMKKLVISVINDLYVYCTAKMKVILICQSSDDTWSLRPDDLFFLFSIASAIFMSHNLLSMMIWRRMHLHMSTVSAFERSLAIGKSGSLQRILAMTSHDK